MGWNRLTGVDGAKPLVEGDNLTTDSTRPITPGKQV